MYSRIKFRTVSMFFLEKRSMHCHEFTWKPNRKKWKTTINPLHVTLRPCWRTITKDSSLASIVSSLILWGLIAPSILDLQVTSLPPCWWTITKDSSLASIVSSTNMAATSLLFDSRGIDCKSRIDGLDYKTWLKTYTLLMEAKMVAQSFRMQ